MTLQSIKSISGEEKIFIKGPSGQLEALVFGMPNLKAQIIPNSEHTNSDDSKQSVPDLSKLYPEIKTIGVVCHPHPLFQGTMTNKVVTTICKAWQSLGLPTVRFNFRGVGESEGSYGEGVGEQLDLEAILAFFYAIFPNVQFWLAGFSFGSYIALQVASNPNPFMVKALLSVAPPVQHFAFDRTGLPTCPWVIIQGTEDSLVPYEKVHQWIIPLILEKPDIQFITMGGAEHFFHGRLIELNTIIHDNFSRLI